jgi:hypothetical protein
MDEREQKELTLPQIVETLGKTVGELNGILEKGYQIGADNAIIGRAGN